MLTIIALIVSVVLQLLAMVLAIGLIRATKYNSSWILISIGLMAMALRRIIEFLPHLERDVPEWLLVVNNWLGILISLLMVIAVFYIRKIFTYLKKTEEIRQESEKKVLNAVIVTEETERKRLAKNLHDDLGPLLSTAKISVSALKDETYGEKETKVFNNAIQAIDEAIRSMKVISNTISPHILNHFGLVKAITSFTDKVRESGRIRIDFNSNLADKRFDFNLEAIIYRVVCELIINTIKHARAGKIMIDLTIENNTIKLNYLDDGKGFKFQEMLRGKTTGMGLSNIYSRVKSLNGTINSDSWPGEGLIITIEIPL